MKTYNKLDSIACEKIKAIIESKNSMYHNLDIPLTIDFFHKRYINQLNKYIDISKATVVDCAAGFGWFTIAYLLAGGKKVFAVDLDQKRLEVVLEIAKILSIDDRLELINSSIHEIPFNKNDVDIFSCIETLEHVGKDNVFASIKKIMSITNKVVLITTPNKFFPVIAHDTRIPFVHMLPPGKRAWIARLFNKQHLNDDNYFLSPLDLKVLLTKFKPATSCMSFETFKDYKDHYPFYLPYGKNQYNRWQNKPSFVKAIYFKIVNVLFGRYSYWLMPSLSSILIKK